MLEKEGLEHFFSVKGENPEWSETYMCKSQAVCPTYNVLQLLLCSSLLTDFPHTYMWESNYITTFKSHFTINSDTASLYSLIDKLIKTR